MLPSPCYKATDTKINLNKSTVNDINPYYEDVNRKLLPPLKFFHHCSNQGLQTPLQF